MCAWASATTMNTHKLCPFCRRPSTSGCGHLALAVEGREFVRRCVESSHAHRHWRTVCDQSQIPRRNGGDWSPEQEDFTWLETAFCDRFLRRLSWFGGMDHEWRDGPRAQGGFWVLLWSKDPHQLWWELHDEFERQCQNPPREPKVRHPENRQWAPLFTTGAES